MTTRLGFLVGSLAVLSIVSCSDRMGPTQIRLEAGVITGTCFKDVNGNGLRDPGEPGFPGVSIMLMTCPPTSACSGITVAQTISASDGSFGFTGVEMGGYRVAEETPGGYVQTIPVGGSNFPVTLDSSHPWASRLLFGNQRQN